MRKRKVVILLSPDFRDVLQFRMEFIKALSKYGTEEEYMDYEYVYLDTENNKIITDTLSLLVDTDKPIHTIKLKPESGENAYKNNFSNLIGYVLAYKDSIVIDFSDMDRFPKFKNKVYKEWANDLNIFLIFYELSSKPLTCCDQELAYINDLVDSMDNDTFDFFRCEICHNCYILLQELMDQYLVGTMEVKVTYRRNFYKGEYGDVLFNWRYT